jgi:hypothetical protein
MAIMLLVWHTNLRGASETFQHGGRLIELLPVRILVVLLLYSLLFLHIRKCVLLQSGQFEILLLLNHCVYGLINLQQALSKRVVALSNYSPASLIVCVDVQVGGSDHVHKVL